MSTDVTIGICAYNEGKNIGGLLSNILYEQELPGNFEILVVCSGCTDNTVDIVERFSKQCHKIHYIVEEERNGKASAVNRILSVAKGSNILFISADTLPNEGCFRKLLLKMQPNVGLVSGNPVPVNSYNSLVGRMVHFLWDFHGTVFSQLNDAGLARHATEIFCVRKNIVDKIPSETINDDAYIALITKKKGWLIKYEPKSQVSICGPQTFADYFKQRRRVLFGHQQVRKLTGESPQHLLYLLPLHPIQVTKLILLQFRKKSVFVLLPFLLVELALNAAAIFDYMLGKNHVKWSVSNSTKTLNYDNSANELASEKD